MGENRRDTRKRRNRRRRSKRKWLLQRILTGLFFFGGMGLLLNGWTWFGNGTEDAKKGLSSNGIVQKYGTKTKAFGQNSGEGEHVKKEKDDTAEKKKTENGGKEKDYPELCGLKEVEKPLERSFSEVLERLETLSEESNVIARIYKNYQLYPEKLLEALANNPEMADFVEKYLSNHGVKDSSLTDSERQQKYPLFLQWDPRWGYAAYGDSSCIGLSGCGPTCLSMVLYYLTGDTALTPDKVAAYSSEHGYYVAGTGTAWALLEDLPKTYHIGVSQLGLSEEGMKAELDQGHLIICVMGPGDFTAAGHFIVIYGYDKKGFKVNDPNCVARSRKRWEFEEIEKQIKNIWTYWKEEGGETEEIWQVQSGYDFAYTK